jgi:uncharacterized protein YodC (DUF2158 family)
VLFLTVHRSDEIARMPPFKQGDTFRSRSGGPLMAVDGCMASGEAFCTRWKRAGNPLRLLL